MMRADEMVAWLSRRWVIGAGFMAAAILALLPIVAALVSRPVLLILLCSPVYMVHQVEEHWNDRFRRFVNAKIFGGRLAMTRCDVLVVNVPVVWGLNLASAYAAFFVSPATGMIAGYAMLVNALGHIVGAERMREYNPGLLSAILLFLPLGSSVIVVVGSLPSTTSTEHLVALGGAIAIHAAIAGSTLRRAADRSNAPPGPRIP